MFGGFVMSHGKYKTESDDKKNNRWTKYYVEKIKPEKQEHKYKLLTQRYVSHFVILSGGGFKKRFFI